MGSKSITLSDPLLYIPHTVKLKSGGVKEKDLELGKHFDGSAKPEPLTIGRGPENNIATPHSLLSGAHLKIDDGKLVDTSTNGTFVRVRTYEESKNSI